MTLSERIKTVFNDGRAFRGAIIGILGLFFAIYVVRNTGVLNPSKPEGALLPRFITIPSEELLEVGNSDFTTVGETIAGNLANQGMDRWLFNGTEGEILDVIVQPESEKDSQIDLVVELYTPDGQRIVKLNQNKAGQPELVNSLVLPQSGEYTLWVSDDKFDTKGRYILHTLNNLTKNSAAYRFSIGAFVRGGIPIPQYQYWVFSGSADQDVSLTLLRLPESHARFAPFFKLYAPDGSLVDEGNSADDGTPLIRNLYLPQNGTYIVWIGEVGFDHNGSFLLTIQDQKRKNLLIPQ